MSRKRGLAAALLALMAARALAQFQNDKAIVVSPELKVSIGEGDEITLAARPLPGEGLDAFVRRFTEDPRTKKEILSQNEGVKLLRKDVFVRVPYRLLSENYRRIAIQALFPDDSTDAEGWNHHVKALTGKPESLWRISEWFTGDGAKYRDVRAANALASLQTQRGQVVRIPLKLLSPTFRDEARAAAAEPAGPLEFGRDEKGRYATYRLRRGEALYSAVVVRLTGRVHAEDVNAKAAEIAVRSGIADVRAIPVGYAVKIPVEDLSPEFRPKDDPARIEEEKGRLQATQFVNRVRAADLAGVTFVLDAGHGGRDSGALVAGVEEARHVYDLACRVERLLAKHTRATVVMTVRRRTPCGDGRAETVADSRSARVMTTPPYDLDDPVAGVNFRWYLANSVLRRAERDGGSEDRTVFVSLHADSLHPAVRGLMVYIPGEKFLKSSFGKSSGIYAARREVREAPRVTFSRRDRIKAEGVSRHLAEKIVAAFRALGLPLHAFQPIRRNVIRGGREWVPAILRYNRIPARVLVEVCNLNNPDDRRLLVSRAYRDKVAQAIVSALVEFYGGEKGQRVAKGSATGPDSEN
ncbi:MAG TPA: N-acetylmuramoyl-L-alanine amidase [Thermoanaerobaculia bacterium]|nr:N-acetylmuramoyl-L-alanine amidase [Thermoanaerobaculia bacterium]